MKLLLSSIVLVTLTVFAQASVDNESNPRVLKSAKGAKTPKSVKSVKEEKSKVDKAAKGEKAAKAGKSAKAGVEESKRPNGKGGGKGGEGKAVKSSHKSKTPKAPKGKKGGSGSQIVSTTSSPIVVEITPETFLQACITKYPGYEGNLDIHGKVVVRFENESMLFKGELDGVDVLCDKCGIHIHSGTNGCNEDLVGGHYWDDNNYKIPSPWTGDGLATYSSLSDGHADVNFPLNAGYDAQENIGHAVVVHDNEGTRYGCGVLFSTSTFEGISCPR